MTTLVLVIHLISCFILILVVLLQSGKGADLAGAFGGMGSQTTFGPRGGATLLSKITTATAVIFMITSLALSIMMSHRVSGSSVMDKASAAKAKHKAVIPVKKTLPPKKKSKEAAATATAKKEKGKSEFKTVSVIDKSGKVKKVQMKHLTKAEVDKLLGRKEPAKNKNETKKKQK